VPDLVQLNMMRKMQEDLLKKTKDVTRAYTVEREDLSAAEKVLLQRLSDDQGKLAGLMTRFVEKFDEMKKKHEQGERK
jgi:hypothetical protein